jgi:hypothetical protein
VGGPLVISLASIYIYNIYIYKMGDHEKTFPTSGEKEVDRSGHGGDVVETLSGGGAIGLYALRERW